MESQREEPILILESSDPNVLGDLSLYRNYSDAEDALETIDVSNNEFFGFTLKGERLSLVAREGRVFISHADDGVDHRKLVHDLLVRSAMHASKEPEVDLSHFAKVTVEDLVRIIGFRYEKP